MKKTIYLSFIVIFFLFSYLTPFANAEEKFTLEKGWNLVSYSVLSDILEFPDRLDGGIYLFILNPINKKYYGGTGYENTLKKFQELYIDLRAFDYEYGSDFDDKYIFNQGFWVYSPERRPVALGNPTSYGPSDEGLEDFYKLFKGWNFISLQTFMNGKKLDDFKGDCNVEKLYSFSNVKQEWGDLDFLIKGEDGFDGLVSTDGTRDDDLGNGFAIKVSNDCQFDFSGGSGTSPPGLPT